jgi:hypothetical protein
MQPWHFFLLESAFPKIIFYYRVMVGSDSIDTGFWSKVVILGWTTWCKIFLI